MAGYNAGGKGYYALDVTNPLSPKLLWKLDDADESFGYSFGKPVFTKNKSGDWIVLLSSGYNNNTREGDGKGWLFSVDPITGEVIDEKGTNQGSMGTPSGFSKFNTWVDDIITDNTADSAYGGDLFGNMFKFNLKINGSSAIRLYNVDRPITVTPELGLINNARIVMFSTGKFIGQSDLYNKDTNYIFAIKDDMTNSFVPNIKDKLKNQNAKIATATTKNGVKTEYEKFI